MPDRNMLLLGLAALLGVGAYAWTKRSRARNTADQFWYLPDGTTIPIPNDIAAEAISLSRAGSEEFCPEQSPAVETAINQFGSDLQATGNPRLALNRFRTTIQSLCPAVSTNI